MRQRMNWLGICAVAALVVARNWAVGDESPAPSAQATVTTASDETGAAAGTSSPIEPAAMGAFVTKGIAWLIAAQHEDGGWGGGSHAQQDVRDPHKVQTDPATTAFTLLSLLRAGHTPAAGEYQSRVRRGLEYLLAAVEKAPNEGPRITELTGTQPQSKLGQFVDTSLTAQYLARSFALLEKSDPLYDRVNSALDKCLGKLQASQQEDGGWGQGGGWAPVLQSSLSCSALEIAQANGKDVDRAKLDKAREYQKRQVQISDGKAVAKTDAGAGVELYGFGGGIRGNAADAREAEKLVQQGVASGRLLAGASVSSRNLQRLGLPTSKAVKLADAAEQNAKQIDRLNDETLLAGFGNNGGEEFLSYLLTSESLVIAGGDRFHKWNDKMHGRLAKTQNGDGSWSGHHCITSPVFCTAAVVQCLTTDRDAKFLIAMAEKTRGDDSKTASISQKP